MKHPVISLLILTAGLLSAACLPVDDSDHVEPSGRTVDGAGIVARNGCGIDAQTAQIRFNREWPPPCASRYGSGAFGRWIADSDGRPAYEYSSDPKTAANSPYPVSDGYSTDQWHFIGNDAIGATVHVDGHVEFYDWSRGGKVINRFEPTTGRLSGGFRLVRWNGRILNTLAPTGVPDTARRLVFGMSYAERRTTSGSLTLTETTRAPSGDDPVLESVTRVENTGDKPAKLELIEYWDVNPVQITPELVTSFGLLKWAWRSRHALNRLFVTHPIVDAETGWIGVQPSLATGIPAVSVDESAAVDQYWKTIGLAALEPWDGDTDYTLDRRAFVPESFDPAGLDGIRWPDARDWGRSFEDGVSLARVPAVLAIRRRAVVEPGQSRTWRYLFGYARNEDWAGIIERRKVAQNEPRPVLADWVSTDGDWLRREITWHADALASGSYRHDYFGTRFIDQGSAYSYLQGLSGAPRDFALFVIPATYIRPDLAKDTLRFILESQDATSANLPYAHVGFGRVTGAVVHEESSDLDLFLLLALSEYVGATGDTAFFDESLPYHPRETGVAGPVIEHARRAFEHLTQTIGLGPHGLIRCGTGDWNDVLLAFTPNHDATVQNGESALNAGLAAFALPRLADVVEERDAAFARELRSFGREQALALRSLWAGHWLARGYLGFGDATLGADRVFLDAQVFPLLAGSMGNERSRQTLNAVRDRLVDPQIAGARSLDRPFSGPLLDPGSDTDGGTWAALDSLLAWGWGNYNRDEAWRFFLSTTLAAHAEAYPDLWYGIWSGPDSFNADDHARPGETFLSSVTPMTDLPVMNMNRHAGPLTALIRLAGFDHDRGRIVIDPRLPFDEFALRTTLMSAAYTRDGMRGSFTPVTDGAVRLAIRAPAGLPQPVLRVNGIASSYVIDHAGRIAFDAPGRVGQAIEWELREAP